LPLHTAADRGAAAARARLPSRFWVYAGFAVLYGVCETLNGNWSQLDMSDLGASTTEASLALTAFWSMVTVGRILFAAIERWLPSHVTYHALHGDSRFLGQGVVRPIYFAILISHILLSVVALPLVLSTFYLSLSGRFAAHRRLARWTFPIWLYVSVTGVVVFLLLQIFGGARGA